ncbi:MAG: DNA adenine methylase [Acidobacteriota bacterium]
MTVAIPRAPTARKGATPTGTDRQRPHPFLKWAGGKGQLLEQFLPLIPSGFRGYVEPFAGSAAVFFRVANGGRTSRRLLADSNQELVNCYRVVRDQVEEVIRILRNHQKLHGNDHYYETRAVRPETLPEVDRAARMIYLNRTCYNGLYRVNSKGLFNVPIGRYVNPRICDAANLRLVSHALRGCELLDKPFEEAPEYCRGGDLVYLDPPYQPISATSKFTSYTAGQFTAEDQERLASVFTELDRNGCLLMMSNSDSPLIRKLYRARFRIRTVRARRAINSRSDRRGPIRELLICNY